VSSEARILTLQNASQLVSWCGGRLVNEQDALLPHINTPGINVPVKGGVQRASLGDTIIHKDDGTFEVFRSEV
jgi:hypothetical protein